MAAVTFKPPEGSLLLKRSFEMTVKVSVSPATGPNQGKRKEKDRNTNNILAIAVQFEANPLEVVT